MKEIGASSIDNNEKYKIDLAKIKIIFECLDVSHSTKEDYLNRIPMFLNYIKNKSLNYNSFLEYKKYLKSRNDYTVSTKNKYLAVARVLLKECNRRGYIPSDITQNIRSFKQIKRHKKNGLDSSEIEKLSIYLGEMENNPDNDRIKAIISLLVFQGLRQVEISRLDINDLDLLRQTVLIKGKGNDDKEIIYLHPETTKHIRNYLKSNSIKDGALFLSKSNNSHNKRITTRGLRMLIKKVLKDLEINKTVHGFRHYFTTNLIKSHKGDLLKVANYTRHRSLEMLQVYNDNIEMEEDLPNYYKTFAGVKF